MQADTGLETLPGPQRLFHRPGGRLLGQGRCLESPGADIPHGIRYSLTLHEPYGKRILGYDNSHAIKPPKKFKFVGQRLPYDHKHRHVADKGVPYEFKDAYQLLAEFFTEVDRVLEEAKK